MSVNLFLNEDVKKAEGFKQDSEGVGMQFNGISIFGPSPHVIHSHREPIPACLLPYIKEISLYEHVSTERMRRETGIYKHESAEAEVQFVQQSKGSTNWIKIKGKSMEHVEELLHKIKVGSLRPTESYEGVQQGKSRLELEREVAELEAQVLVQADALNRHQTAIADGQINADRVRAVRQLAADLDRKQWPWCLKSTVATRINLALNGKSEG